MFHSYEESRPEGTYISNNEVIEIDHNEGGYLEQYSRDTCIYNIASLCSVSIMSENRSMGKKQTKNRSIWTRELRSMIAGWVLAFLCVLVFIGDTKSIVGKTLASSMVAVFGDYYMSIFALYSLLAV